MLQGILQRKKLESMKEKLSNIKDGSPGLLREVLEAVNLGWVERNSQKTNRRKFFIMKSSCAQDSE